ncbi:MAG: hypothetical protein A3B91_00800 [Candidatus Yanofskybacteria bacterium RIFCSPHIGHO2_02_FULL_41_29]|uniref:Uncharacterized protein n=1 Tax=Candidatus Yanofskybacteria bacterium RIFCSPHIGHO2_01_FULL_41_53 TaxID=1802663 RepID=A0A1F8EJU3_9BACT|nr:MAG: hypothetical protein A2650_00370 [Candidatus Yanofskybacteria bacterium RIFCSPHIGHO2_01_FULL_41_53]OGN12281.1 MAG: hypothetical protein A3B91_00800 [Candidatus Yanofskybacteria bacterium RIFCSPHIGHO2_02_FULL_41_29]OGN17018.1 MAG: hypothetical protein A3F48_03670 [Candidatus Yanofskybacteria bacterium RIFCSPHIGHO2_12_FULL_41_9]OGN23620.1 MAG: hypothetical protein A2916_01515 [Candidatus Yanofskybacteria bacterium RIFCSPLOWO2_01_FULL_41_67]OGN29393.1 MAG: hypothetical protein A3H54_04010 
MKNPLTYHIESSLGAVFISLLALFFVGILFVAIKNFNTDVDVMTIIASNNKVSRVSQTERYLMQEWIKSNSIEIPEGSGTKYLLRKYPSRPWLN